MPTQSSKGSKDNHKRQATHTVTVAVYVLPMEAPRPRQRHHSRFAPRSSFVYHTLGTDYLAYPEMPNGLTNNPSVSLLLVPCTCALAEGTERRTPLRCAKGNERRQSRCFFGLVLYNQNCAQCTYASGFLSAAACVALRRNTPCSPKTLIVRVSWFP